MKTIGRTVFSRLSGVFYPADRVEGRVIVRPRPCLHQREPRFVVGVVHRWCGVAVLFIRDLVECIVPVRHRHRRIALSVR